MNKEQILSQLAYNDEYKITIAKQLDVLFNTMQKHNDLSGVGLEIKDLSSSVEFLFHGFSVNYIYLHFEDEVKDYVNDIQMKLISWQISNHIGLDYPVVVCKTRRSDD